MSHSSPQTFLRELDKKLWTAADKLPVGTEIKESGRLAQPYKITSTGKLIDDALNAVEKENPKFKNVPVASVCDRRTLRYRIARRHPHDFKLNPRPNPPRKTSDGRRPTLQLQIDPANLAGLIDDVEDDGEAFDDKMARLTADLALQFTESAKLESSIKVNLKGLGFAL